MRDGINCLAKVTSGEQCLPQADMSRPESSVDAKGFSEAKSGLINLSRTEQSETQRVVREWKIGF